MAGVARGIVCVTSDIFAESVKTVGDVCEWPCLLVIITEFHESITNNMLDMISR